mmetsp:Transcript_13286/g.29084  ORF Transcript_13286/g.29084 Transcript_13286/m.29084 type:complete len:120 (+) Transcript_13286:386-745(+)
MELVPVKSSVPGVSEAGARFSVFNMQANRKVFAEFVDQRDFDQRYIEDLEKILKSMGVQPPERPDPKAAKAGLRTPADYNMADGSQASLHKAIDHFKDQVGMGPRCLLLVRRCVLLAGC